MTIEYSMRISFDLDDTLICYDSDVPCEPNRVPRLLRSWFDEPLRAGTIEMMQQLQKQGWQIWIYTTSARPPRQVKRWLKFYGIDVAAVVNQELHEQHVRRSSFPKSISKYPPAFGIVLHVDDLEGVALEGLKNGFDVLVVSLGDKNWTQRVLERAQQKQRELSQNN